MRTETTIRPDAPTTLEGLKAAYRAEVEALIAKHPTQETNRARYLADLDNARLARVTRRFASKGDYTVLPVGATVLVTFECRGYAMVFAPSIRGLKNESSMAVANLEML